LDHKNFVSLISLKIFSLSVHFLSIIKSDIMTRSIYLCDYLPCHIPKELEDYVEQRNKKCIYIYIYAFKKYIYIFFFYRKEKEGGGSTRPSRDRMHLSRSWVKCSKGSKGRRTKRSLIRKLMMSGILFSFRYDIASCSRIFCDVQ